MPFATWPQWRSRPELGNSVVLGFRVLASYPFLLLRLGACAKNYDEELKVELALRHSRPSLPGVGFILVRDSSAALVGAVAMKAPGMVYVLAAELYAIKMGISFAFDAYLIAFNAID
ncbi:PREDICTED: PRUPE_2G069500 [Prunus dulcis]|uniref:PREDICTED: PRUPE_2G069500 n=1 Tax=Prunus dulcis TaxID=3755 RepID=A0A5E4EXC6_PRUDU|nr:PREDICTED: PRUPE_2G069500 [Prunus dulcis]